MSQQEQQYPGIAGATSLFNNSGIQARAHRDVCLIEGGAQPLSGPGGLLAEHQHEQGQDGPDLLVAEAQLD